LNLEIRDLESAEQSIDVAQERMALAPAASMNRNSANLLKARLHYLHAMVLRRGEDLAGAMNEYWTAEQAFAALSTPTHYDAYAELRRGETLYFISSLNAERGRHPEALSAALTAKAIGESLVKRRPDSARAFALLGRARHGVAGAFHNMGRFEEAVHEYGEAAAVEREACRLAPWEPDYQRFLANHLIGRGRVYLSLNQAEEALQMFDECCKTQPNTAYYHWATAWELWNRLAQFPYRNGADKRRFLEATLSRFQRAAELKSTEWLALLGGGQETKLRPRPSRQTAKSP
jgi:tetratricopeptide (TPR) repeat protein